MTRRKKPHEVKKDMEETAMFKEPKARKIRVKRKKKYGF